MLAHDYVKHSRFTSAAVAASVGGHASAAELAAALGRAAPSPLQDLVAQARRVVFDPQRVVYHEGSTSDTVLFITGGLLKLVAHLRNGRARIVRLHRPGSVIGLSGLLQRRHQHTAVTVTQVSALRLPVAALEQLRAEEPTSYISLLERWHNYLKEADIWITQFSTGPIRGRVARLLTFLAAFQPDTRDTEVQLLTCEEMGFILGVTTESVSRSLAEFKRENILVNEKRSEYTELYEADLEQLNLIASQ